MARDYWENVSILRTPHHVPFLFPFPRPLMYNPISLLPSSPPMMWLPLQSALWAKEALWAPLLAGGRACGLKWCEKMVWWVIASGASNPRV